MMKARTTVAADPNDLNTLKSEAKRRGVPLSTVLAEAVHEKATAVRQRRRPQIGIVRSTDGRSAAEVASEPIARPPA